MKTILPVGTFDQIKFWKSATLKLTILAVVMGAGLYQTVPAYVDYRMNKDVYTIAKTKVNASREQVKSDLIAPKTEAKELPKQ